MRDKYTARKCYRCEKDIFFKDFEEVNTDYDPDNSPFLEEIWNSPYVKLFCCFCFWAIKNLTKLSFIDFEKLIKIFVKG